MALPAPSAVDDAPDAAGVGNITSGTEVDAAPAGQPTALAALAPALSPAVPGAWAALAQSSHGSLPAAEGGADIVNGLVEGAEPALLPDAQLSLSGDRLQDDATCALATIIARRRQHHRAPRGEKTQLSSVCAPFQGSDWFLSSGCRACHDTGRSFFHHDMLRNSACLYVDQVRSQHVSPMQP